MSAMSDRCGCDMRLRTLRFDMCPIGASGADGGRLNIVAKEVGSLDYR